MPEHPRDANQRPGAQIQGQQPQYHAYGWPPPEDEISLFDIWDALVRRKWLIVGVAALVTLFALTHAVMKPDVYPYRTAIEIGTYLAGGSDPSATGWPGLQLVESVQTARQKLEQVYVPVARSEASREGRPAPAVEVLGKARSGNERGVGLFVLRSAAAPNASDAASAVHQQVVDAIREDHQKLMAPIEARQQQTLSAARDRLEYFQRTEVERARIEPLEQAIGAAQNRLAELETQYHADRRVLRDELANKQRTVEQLAAERARLQEQIERVRTKQQLVEKQLSSQEGMLERLESARIQATQAVDSSADSLAILTIGAQLDRARQRADNLEEELEVGLPGELGEIRASLDANQRTGERASDEVQSLKAELQELEQTYQQERLGGGQELAAARTNLAKGRADYERDVGNQRRQVEQAEIAMQQLSPTRPLFVAEQGGRATGPGSLVIGMLGVILGGMLGIFAAFAAEFADAARRRHANLEGQASGSRDSNPVTESTGKTDEESQAFLRSGADA